MVGPGGVEPPTSRLSGVRSNQLSYEPMRLSGPSAIAPTPLKTEYDAQQTTSMFDLGRSPYREGLALLLRKEVIQPHLPIRLPCYDFIPLTKHTFGASLPCGLGQRLRVHPTRVM